jgi:CRP/FNR family transcriptional regulator
MIGPGIDGVGVPENPLWAHGPAGPPGHVPPVSVLELFEGCPPGLAEAVESRLEVIRWDRRNRPPPALFTQAQVLVIRSGHLAMLAPVGTCGERQVMTGLLSVGGVFTCNDAAPGPVGLPVSDHVMISPIPERLLERILVKCPAVGTNLTRLLSDRIAMLRETVALVSQFRVEDRLLGRIGQLAERFGIVTPRGVELRLDLTHAQWGSLLGASRAATTLAFGRLRETKQVELDGRVIILPPGPAAAALPDGPAVEELSHAGPNGDGDAARPARASNRHSG